uniref:Reverse transcriptase domain-containing protein n=1 Tax=Steinernema glaseri TaxID=37863 RepID=A0A1I7Y315_9BILA
MLDKYGDVFKDRIGRCAKAEASLKFKQEPKPKFCMVRMVPYAVKAKVEENLARQVHEGIPKPIEHSEFLWTRSPRILVSSLVRGVQEMRDNNDRSQREKVSGSGNQLNTIQGNSELAQSSRLSFQDELDVERGSLSLMS